VTPVSAPPELDGLALRVRMAIVSNSSRTRFGELRVQRAGVSSENLIGQDDQGVTGIEREILAVGRGQGGWPRRRSLPSAMSSCTRKAFVEHLDGDGHGERRRVRAAEGADKVARHNAGRMALPGRDG